MNVTSPVNPPDEPYLTGPLNPESPRGLLPAIGYFLPPTQFLENPAGPEQSDGRLNSTLRSYAQTRNAQKLLAEAVKAYIANNTQQAFALAQLAVTGSNAFSTFAGWHPQDNELVEYVRQTIPDSGRLMVLPPTFSSSAFG
jgi:hypothetical protein